MYTIYEKLNRDRAKPINLFFYSFIISDFPMLLALFSYLASHWSLICSYPPARLVSVLAASIWTFFGPYMIVRWEQGFIYFCDWINLLADNSNFGSQLRLHELHDCRWRNRIFSIVWTAVIMIILLLPSGREALKLYYFDGLSDPNYWMFLLCVGYVAYQTSWFFLYMLFSWNVVSEVIQDEKITRKILLNEGRSDGLMLIGNLVSNTAISFGTGLMFFPILVVIFVESGQYLVNGLNTTALVFALMGLYILFITTYLFGINKRCLTKFQLAKDKEMSRANHNSKGEGQLIDEFRLYRLSNLKTNVLAEDQYMKLTYGIVTSAFLPAVFSVLLSL